MKVLVLGGGVVGLAAAYYLARDGHEVTVVERNGGVGLETSYANGGQLSYSYVAPLASPGVLPKIPPWLLRRDSPLRFRPALDPHQWRWCAEFVLACTQRQADLTTRRLLRLAYYSRALMHRFVAAEPAQFDYVRNGKLVVHADGRRSSRRDASSTTRRASARSSRRCRRTSASRSSPRWCDAAAACRRDLHAERGRGRLLRVLREPRAPAPHGRRGVPARHRDSPAARWRERILGVETSRGVLEADRYVLALGAASPRLVRPLGIRLPIYPLKGYSLTLAIGPHHVAPRISITDFKKKIVYARLGDELRVAGMADLAGYAPTIDESRVATLADETRAAFPEASDFSQLRPGAACGRPRPRGRRSSARRAIPTCSSTAGRARSASRSRSGADG